MGVSKIGHRLAIKSIIDDLRGVSLDNSGRYDATNPVPLKFNYRRIIGGGGQLKLTLILPSNFPVRVKNR